MTLEEFRKQTNENPQGFMFDILCKKCYSENVTISINGDIVGGGGGCDSCGYGGESEVGIDVLIKCGDCGNAFHDKRQYQK